MAKNWSRTEAFRHFGTTLTNKRCSWSARSVDGDTVVLALWSDRFNRTSKPVQYNDHRTSSDQNWVSRPGNRERIDNLKWARDRCDGLFKVVMVRPKDAISDPREIDECWPKDGMVMKLVELNETTGEFRSVLVTGVDTGV